MREKELKTYSPALIARQALRVYGRLFPKMDAGDIADIAIDAYYELIAKQRHLKPIAYIMRTVYHKLIDEVHKDEDDRAIALGRIPAWRLRMSEYLKEYYIKHREERLAYQKERYRKIKNKKGVIAA